MVLVGVFLFFISFLAVSTSHFGLIAPVSAQSDSGTLIKSSSGLIASDPLNSTLSQSQLASSSYWKFDGDAPLVGSPYAFYEDSGGLHIGVESVNQSTFVGYYAVSPSANFVLAHATITAPTQQLSAQGSSYNSGLYIQTSDGNVSYIACSAVTTSAGTSWEVGAAIGNTTQVTHLTLLYEDKNPNQPATGSCTIITNGNNYLTVYLNGNMIYQNSTMNLQIPQPLRAYLETETTYTGGLLNATFQDYYLTNGGYVNVTGLPSSAAKVLIVDPNGTNVLASADVVNGTASVPIGGFDFPLQSVIQVLSSSGQIIASTPSAVSLYGGDVFEYESPPPPITTTTVTVASPTTTTATLTTRSTVSSVSTTVVTSPPSTATRTVTNTVSVTVTSSDSLSPSGDFLSVNAVWIAIAAVVVVAVTGTGTFLVRRK